MTKYFKVENERIYELSANVVEVVRCKECKSFKKLNEAGMGVCRLRYGIELGMMDYDYCSNGERVEQTEPSTDCGWK